MGVDGVEHIGPYRVAERLGVGGMGEVYKAYDDRLDRWVAIKRIRPDKEEAEEHRERFRREARAAARLNHTAIVHVYDIFQEGDSDCIVMELVEGRSLDQLIAEGPLEPYRAAELGRQVAAGLAEAHDKRILHRDLKAENVIVTLEEQSKILDFGLAKPLIKGDLDTSLTGRGQVVGTSRAMSPEYVSGDEVDHRSDLFSLGVLLYETVTGQSPFKAHNTLATLKRVILHRQTPAHEVNPAVPVELSFLIDRLLEKEPEDRPQTAREVVQALGRIVGRSSSDAHESPFSSMSTVLDLPGLGRPRQPPVWRWIAISLAALLAVATAYGLWTRQQERTDDDAVIGFQNFDFELRDRIVVGDMVNNTGETDLDDVFDEPFHTAFAQSRYASVLPPQQVLASLERMAKETDATIDRRLGIEICKREGAKALILGRIDKSGTGYRVTAEIVHPLEGRSLYSYAADAADRDEILAAIDKAATQVRSVLGESLASLESTSPLEKVTTPNFAALRAYSLAIDLFNQGRYDQAIPLLEHAVQLDPEFATAHAVLGTSYRNEDVHLDRAIPHFRAADQYRERLTEVERLYVKGVVTTWLGGTPKEMLDAWSVLAQLYPERLAGHYNLAMVRWHYYNDFQQAADLLSRAAKDSGQVDVSTALNRGRMWVALGRYEQAINELEALGELESSSFDGGITRSNLADALAEAYLADKRYDAVRELLDESAPVIEDLPLDPQILLEADQGRLREALALAETGEARAEANDDTFDEHANRMARLALLEARGSTETLRRTLRGAIAPAREYLRQEKWGRPLIPSVPLLAILGKLSARHGLLADAKAIAAELRPLVERDSFEIWDAYLNLLAGEIATARGDPRRGIASFRKSLEQVETIQAHESLARALVKNGDVEAAIGEYSWLVEHRGRVFPECAVNCFDRTANLVGWASAIAELATLYELQGETELSLERTRQLLEHWRDGDSDLGLLAEARERLARLDPASGSL